jgi:exopolyphosphatase/guanosine-5'-triphosphate,3'-diphosphate pyrophosphatase
VRVAALDLGSNTFLLLIAEVKGGKIERVLHDEVMVTRLGQGIHAKREFHPEALIRADQCLKKYRETIDRLSVDRVAAVATSAARDAKNSAAFFKIAEKHKIPVRILSGDEEAEVTFLGATSGREELEGLAVIDVGGGSTEIIGSKGGRLSGCSLDLGSVRLTELFLPRHPCAEEDLSRLEEYVASNISGARPQIPTNVQKVIAVAGTPTTLAMLKLEREFVADLIEGSELSVAEILVWRDRLARMSVADRETLNGMPPGRADVLVAGLTILARASEALGCTNVSVSTQGVRHGLARWMSEGRA